MNAAICVHDVTFRAKEHFYSRPKTILHSVSFTVPQGSICGFVGANGAGKTTTLQLLLGQLQPTSGRLSLFGQDASLPAARVHMGFLPEKASGPTTLTAHQLVRAHGLLRGLPRNSIEAHAQQALYDVQLQHHSHRPLRNFSKGMLQRVGLAQALVGNPRLLLLDEPLSGLDPPGRHLVRELLAHLGRQGRTVFFSTHMLADVELLCDQVVVLRDGRVVHSGAPSHLVENGAQNNSMEVVAHNVDAAGCALAHALGATSSSFGSRQRFIVNTLADANTLAKAILECGGTLHRVAPHGGGALEAMLLSDAQNVGEAHAA